ncbi:hypothetical protein [Alcanivorax sp. 1008]|uniref:hypothetical protein n=1 Tax=Alcanivorax sp. 1008 TaxID=2816853 RepID=UPI001D98282C|nr:hypothetical protein [Alcanivorax sp. 1008]MCC1498210.1 hypothetical protein [Alcanivorax sp. 1008]
MANIKITPEFESEIEVMINAWEGKLTFKSLVSRIFEETGVSVTRQALVEYQSIRKAYDSRKSFLKRASSKRRGQDCISSRDGVAIKRLRSEIEILTRKNAEQLCMIERILANASEIHAIDLRDLVKGRSEEAL